MGDFYLFLISQDAIKYLDLDQGTIDYSPHLDPAEIHKLHPRG